MSPFSPPECVTSHGKRDFADVIKGLEVRRLIWIIQVAQCNHRGLLGGGDVGGSESEKDVRTEAEAEIGSCCAAGFEGGGRGHEPRDAGASEAGKDEATDSAPWSLQKEQGPADSLILACWDPRRPLTCREMIRWGCFQLLRLWPYTTAAIGAAWMRASLYSLALLLRSWVPLLGQGQAHHGACHPVSVGTPGPTPAEKVVQSAAC